MEENVSVSHEATIARLEKRLMSAYEVLASTGAREERYAAAIRRHMNYRGDDRCCGDDHELYSVLPEGDTRPERETLVTLENCEHFIRCRQTGREYVSPQRRIEELETQLDQRLRQTSALQAAAGIVITDGTDWADGDDVAFVRQLRERAEQMEAEVADLKRQVQGTATGSPHRAR